MDEVKACDMCVNAYIDPELSSDNDLSYFGIGSCSGWYRMLFRTGSGRPTEILVERHSYGKGWHTIGVYRPKFCPNCGRELRENNPVPVEGGEELGKK